MLVVGSNVLSSNHIIICNILYGMVNCRWKVSFEPYPNKYYLKHTALSHLDGDGLYFMGVYIDIASFFVSQIVTCLGMYFLFFGGEMNISFIGAGHVGTAFAKYISKDVDVLYFNSKTKTSAEKACAYIGCEVASLETLVKDSEIIFITTGDNAISSVAKELSSLNVSDKTFVHMSGAMTTDELILLKNQGAHTCSMHPLQTFSDTEKAVKDLKNAYFALEGDYDKLESLVKQLGNPYFTLSKEQKNKYHLSACIFSNYLVTLMNYGSRMLSSIGIDEDDGLQAMKPLIDATLSNVFMKGTEKSLTGPIQRSDTKTLEKHMSELKGLDLEAYQLLGKMTTETLIMDENKKSILDALWRRK